tara:strand:- start:165 stop:392 length:228 start_codon:yes stop_codon:yes gene_type:complete
MSARLLVKMSYFPKNNQPKKCFKKTDNFTKEPIDCSEYLDLYYNFITENPLKFSGDFIREIGNCGISGCDLPSDR